MMLPSVPQAIGQCRVSTRQAKTILTKATGFIDAFDYSLNPYTGCSFGCHYCYAAFFAGTPQQQADWGKWVVVKENAVALVEKLRPGKLDDQWLYLSSVTDPYQPIEQHLGLTRALLTCLAQRHRVRLVVQTRSPLILRDLDVLAQFPYVRVNMTVTTDDEAVRRAFEPLCPSVTQRLAAIAQVAAAGIDTCITLTPLLPLVDAAAFAARLKATGVQRFVVQEFHASRSRFVAGTGATAIALAQAMAWTPAAFGQAVAVLRRHLPDVRYGKAGFAPVWHIADPTAADDSDTAGSVGFS